MRDQACAKSRCQDCALRARSVLCDLPDVSLAEWDRMTHRFGYGPRETVFYEGHACLGLYLLSGGKVKLTRSSSRGQRHIVRIVEAGCLIEPHTFRSGTTHLVTCETLEPSQICLIERTAYLAMIQRAPSVAVNLIHLLSGELERRQEAADGQTFKSAKERLAALLLELGQRFGEGAGERVEVQLTLKREEIAELLGVTAETAIRLLGTFRDEGLISFEGRAITLLNQTRLARIAHLQPHR